MANLNKVKNEVFTLENQIRKTKILYDMRWFFSTDKYPKGIYIYKILYEIYLVLSKMDNIELYAYEDNFKNIKSNKQFPNLKWYDKDNNYLEIDIFISSELKKPSVLSKKLRIRSFLLLNDVLNSLYNLKGNFIEDTLFNITDEYDYFLTFSSDIRNMFLSYVGNIDPDRIRLIQFLELSKEVEEEGDGSDFTFISVFSSSYEDNLEKLISSFNEYRESRNINNLSLIIGVDDSDTYSLLMDNLKLNNDFESIYNNIEIRLFNSDDERKMTIAGADCYIDILSYNDVNLPLLESVYSDCRMIITTNKGYESLISRIGGIYCDLAEKSLIKYFDTILIPNKTLNRSYLFNENINSCFEKQIFNNTLVAKKMPLVTVVTITLDIMKNGRKEFFKECIQSVHQQSYGNIEHIIIDGASTDGTLEFLAEYEKLGWLKVYSEKDSGLYDAMNKGLSRAKGKYIGYLNSDDFYHDIYGVEKTVETLEKLSLDYSYSDVKILNEDNSIYNWIADIRNILYARNYCHQSLFVRRDIMNRLNGFDISYKVSSDSDIMIRLFKNKYKNSKTDYCFVTYRGGGISAQHWETSRQDHSRSFFTHLGRKYKLTRKDCYLLWQYRFLDELHFGEQIRLVTKVSSFFNTKELINEIFKRNLPNGKIKSFVKKIAKKLKIRREVRMKKDIEYYIYYFFKLPFLFHRK